MLQTVCRFRAEVRHSFTRVDGAFDDFSFSGQNAVDQQLKAGAAKGVSAQLSDLVVSIELRLALEGIDRLGQGVDVADRLREALSTYDRLVGHRPHELDGGTV